MSGRIVVVAYKPKPGKQIELEKLCSMHHTRLLNLGLVTPRLPITFKANDNSIVEIFEWVSNDAIHAAHSNPEVLKMWKEFSEVCDYIPAGQIKEFQNMFSEFTPME